MSLARHLRSHSKLSRNSSVNSTWHQSPWIQLRCSAAHLLRFARCVAVNGIYTIGLRVYKPPLWSLFRIVWFRIFRPVLTKKKKAVLEFASHWLFCFDELSTEHIDHYCCGRTYTTLLWSTMNVPCFLKSSSQSCNDTSCHSRSIRYTSLCLPGFYSLPIICQALSEKTKS